MKICDFCNKDVFVEIEMLGTKRTLSGGSYSNQYELCSKHFNAFKKALEKFGKEAEAIKK